MLEITSDDIADLADDVLRALVARLCEAEMRKRGLPSAAVTWGGMQESPDGGIDVRVSLPNGTLVEGFIPRPNTGFQVKKPDMQPADIISEMRPHGAIRPSIQSLATEGGAYIIVSGNGSTADDALQRRRDAMAVAINDIADSSKLLVDFYDRSRVATWLRDHPGLVPWAREKAGRPIAGWQSYGAWANPAEGVVGEYLIDDAPRIRTGAKDGDQGVSAIEGIQHIRHRLDESGKATRLVGLSGVGKTRLVQALFDGRVGVDALDPALAIYTNLGDSPDPPPLSVVSNLVANRVRAIAIIDNCPPDLHRRLTDITGSVGSKVSVLTVEYDIREDQPEGTEVFEMEPSSIAMMEKLLQKRFSEISHVDAERIADFSGGNARVAIALAGTVQRGESVSGLADDELFRRLFHQNHESDPALLRAAEAFALTYSFDGEDIEANGELTRLGKLAGQDVLTLYARVAELRRRDLVQARNNWRAILPHAVANRLAKLALQNLPLKLIEKHLVTEAPERIKKSLSRRLSYLHDSPEAQQIVERWLGRGGILSDVAELDELHAEMFRNVAPVAPLSVLTAIECAACGPKRDQLFKRHDNFVRLLRSLAYEPAFFERCAELLTDFAVADNEEKDATKALTSLFSIYLSGTHATIEQRIGVMERLLKSAGPRRWALGLEVLRVLLQTSHFVSSHDFQFGSRSRDHGYHPTFLQAQAWYRAVLLSAETIALSDLPIAQAVQQTIGVSFRGLWTDVALYDEIERTGIALLTRSYWRDGWIGARQTLRYDARTMPDTTLNRLIALEKKLRPKNLVQKVRSIVLPRSTAGVDLEEYEEDDTDSGRSYQRTEALAERLGEEVGVDADALDELVPDLVTTGSWLFSFGRGLAAGSIAPRSVWEALVKAFSETSETQRGTHVLRGVLQQLMIRDAALTNELLDEAVSHPALGPRFPELQCAVPIDGAGVERLRRSLALGIVPIDGFNWLAWGRAHEPICSADLQDLAERISAMPGGNRIALEIIFFRIHSDKEASRPHEREIVAAGRTLLEQLTFDDSDAGADYKLGITVTSCLAGPSGEVGAKKLLQGLRAAVTTHTTRILHHHDLLEALCRVQPRIVLQTLFGGDEQERQTAAGILAWSRDRRGSPLDTLASEEIVEWCDVEPASRYATLASVVSYLRTSEDEAGSQWSDIALKLLARAPDPVAVARAFVARFHPRSWGGSLVPILESRKGLLSKLERSNNPQLAAFAREERGRLAASVEAASKREAERDRLLDERFE